MENKISVYTAVNERFYIKKFVDCIMKAGGFFLVLLNLILLGFFVFYWLNPGVSANFLERDINPEFNIGNSSAQMQFYENMRFPTSNISYKIDNDCSLTKKRDMKVAFEMLANETDLSFYPVLRNEEITVSCQERNRMDGDLYIAGEGGPTNITDSNLFKVILHGNILLLRDSNCERPNVGVHELLHVLGFNHSTNKNNIMYPISNCKQTIGKEIPQLIDDLYSYPTKQDLTFGKSSASIDGRYLDLNFSVMNQGLKKSEKTVVDVYADNKKIKEFELNPIDIGGGIEIRVNNILLTKAKIENLSLSIPESNAELSNSNNEVLLMKN